MKTKILLLSLMTSLFVVQMYGQNRTRVNAMNDEISDNLDLRAVTDIFGDSRNLQDFERRLNDPELQISNLDLNYDNEVDYLRVIETVDFNIHVIIIQSVFDRNVYQDVATIEVEKDRYNRVHIQVVGNEYMYGPNYIYEPDYYSTPLIYSSLWSYNYRPYVSNWYWNFYPSYYYAWNPFPVYRYRNNIQLSLNIYNNYNYVTSRRSNQAVVLYNSRRSSGYERQYPNYAFSRRNATASNRYELDQTRSASSIGSLNETGYSKTRNNSPRELESRRTGNQREYYQNRTTFSRESAPQRTEAQRNNSQNNRISSRESGPQRTEPQRDNTKNNRGYSRESRPQRTESPIYNSKNRSASSKQSTPQRTENQRDNSQNRGASSRESTSQRNASNRSEFPYNKDGNNSSKANNKRR
ncbi:hypothetical protein [Flavobacterium sp. W22_SRS_FP1]|uniref:hypothetical protein n=1 Tax=Flavobacterium sp. W22_SRS_FP1 TaxID=3240276 RepID=UPI003F9100B8